MRELAVMLGAGLDLDRALRFLVETAPNQRVAGVLDRIRAACAMAARSRQHWRSRPRASPRCMSAWCGLAKPAAGLRQRSTGWPGCSNASAAWRQTSARRLVYPVVLVVAAVGSIALLLVQVLPQFVPLFQQNGASLPGPTQFLVDAGAAVSAWGLQALVLLLAGGLLLRQALRRPGPRLAADRLLLKVPVLGGMLREVLAARFSRTFGTLLVNGMPLITALDVARDTLGNMAAAQAVDQAIQAARGGGDLSQALRLSGAFPLRLPTLLRLGHETAQLGPIALHAAEIHEEASRLGLQRAVALLVPAITIVMGAIIAGIVASLLLAMLSLNDLAG